MERGVSVDDVLEVIERGSHLLPGNLVSAASCYSLKGAIGRAVTILTSW